ncbi:hypothetical protein ACFSC4_26260 [Deinococcus malanensis]|uniref:hypothetical protein n=1 Tax=Deinococcus malanensis TaxID=1706855 RepID=UPI003640E0CA
MTRVPSAPGSQVASLTLNTYQPRQAWRGLIRMGTDHLHLHSVPGLTFYRLLGTGRGADLTLNADLRRWARFAVWSSLDALDRFEASAWRQQERGWLTGSCTVVLRPDRWRGRWGGVEPLGPPAAGAGGGSESPVAVLTRAAIRPARMVSFWRAVPASQQHLGSQPGLLASVGAGEVPCSIRRRSASGAAHRTCTRSPMEARNTARS